MSTQRRVGLSAVCMGVLIGSMLVISCRHEDVHESKVSQATPGAVTEPTHSHVSSRKDTHPGMPVEGRRSHRSSPRHLSVISAYTFGPSLGPKGRSP
jgi:hypothetical protein